MLSSEQSTPQICGKCNGPTYLTIKCINRHKTMHHLRCDTWNGLGTQTCIGCNGKIEIEDQLQEAYQREDARLCDIFLQGCLNLNTDEQNLDLLFHGFAHFHDRHIPNEIIKICVIYVFDIGRLNKKYLSYMFLCVLL